MRPDQTDPGTNNISTRPDGWNPDAAERPERPERTDAGDRDARMREARSRAGSPSPAAIEGRATSWQDIKSQFVDDPAGAIAAAEQLAQLAVEQKVRSMKDELAALCAPGRDEDESTEARRTRLIRYQEYCERLARSAAH